MISLLKKVNRGYSATLPIYGAREIVSNIFHEQDTLLLEYESEVIECDELLRFYRERSTLLYTRVWSLYWLLIFIKLTEEVKPTKMKKLTKNVKPMKASETEISLNYNNPDCCWLSSDKTKPSSTLRDCGVASVKNSVTQQRHLDSLFEVITLIWERMGF